MVKNVTSYRNVETNTRYKNLLKQLRVFHLEVYPNIKNVVAWESSCGGLNSKKSVIKPNRLWAGRTGETHKENSV